MTPKEKAIHLAIKFTSSTDVVKPNMASIEMSLLCVGEILTPLFKFPFKNIGDLCY